MTAVSKAFDKAPPPLNNEISSLWANTAFAACSSRSSGGACIFIGDSRALRRSAPVPWLLTAPSGWHLPGGGVETGETLLEALTRELAEEGNIQLGAAPQLYSVYFNRRTSRRDHVALFIVRDFRQDGNPKPNHEIAEHAFFPIDALPEDASRATRARVAEVFGGAAISELW